MVAVPGVPAAARLLGRFAAVIDPVAEQVD
jgi:hypothetical protein